jgi:hypothetical protein
MWQLRSNAWQCRHARLRSADGHLRSLAAAVYMHYLVACSINIKVTQQKFTVMLIR